jgi:hypothetical protein
LDDDPGHRLDEVAVAGWFLDTFGMKEHGWICPSAPFRANRTNGGGYGRINQAWISTRFDQTRELFIDIPTDRVVQPTFRAGSYGLNLYVFKTERSFAQINSFIYPIRQEGMFKSETRVQHPSLTPVFPESTFWYHFPDPNWTRASGQPPTWVPDDDLKDLPNSGLSVFLIARHGNRPGRPTVGARAGDQSWRFPFLVLSGAGEGRTRHPQSCATGNCR